MAIREKLVAKFPAVPHYRQELSASHFHLGGLLSRLGKAPEAEDQYRKAFAILEKLVAEAPTVPLYRFELANCCSVLGHALMGLRKYPQADEQFRMGLTLSEKLVAEFPSDPDYRYQLSYIRNSLGLLSGNFGNHSEAEDQFRKALPILEVLAADFPRNTTYQVFLGGCCCNLGNALRNKGRVDDSLPLFSRGIRILNLVLENESNNATARQFLRNSYRGRAFAHDRLLKHPEAIADWDKAIEFSTNGNDRAQIRASRAMSQAKAGLAAEAIAEAAELTKLTNWNPVQWYDFACMYSLASGKLLDQNEVLAARAMELLQRATNDGYKDISHMKKDTDLDPIRDRDDFKKFIADLEVKNLPKMPEKK